MDGDASRLPVDTGTADTVYVWGVFTNIMCEHAETCVPEFARIARPAGRAFLTAYVEPDCPVASYNLEDYVPFDHVAPLQVVRYNQDWLFSFFANSGLTIVDFPHHGGMFPKQSEIILAAAGPVSNE